MDMAPSLSSTTLKVIRNRHAWFVAIIFAVIVILHYPQQLPFWDSTIPSSFLGLTRHAVERVFLLVPITYASFIFGIRGGIISLLAALLIMLPRVIFISPTPVDALFEISSVVVIGCIVHIQGGIELSEVTLADDRSGLLPCSAQGRYKYRHQEGNDCDDHQQFH